MSKSRIVQIPAMSIRIDDAPDDTSAIYMALARAHSLVGQSATVLSVSDAPMGVEIRNPVAALPDSRLAAALSLLHSEAEPIAALV